MDYSRVYVYMEVYSTWTTVECMFPAVNGGLLYTDYSGVYVSCSVFHMDYNRVHVYCGVWTGGLLNTDYSRVYVYCSEWRFTPHGL